MASAPYDTYDYPAWWRGREFEHKAETIALIRLLSGLERRKSVIDIGAGFGRLTPTYASFFSRATLVDSSEKLLAIAKNYLADAPNISFVKTDVSSLPFPDNCFDVAISVRVIHHFNDPKAMIAEMQRVVKEGGYCIVEFANKIHFEAMLWAWFKGKFKFRSDLDPRQRQSNPDTIQFVNHHPLVIQDLLERNNLKIIQILSVSNLRYTWFKKIFPVSLLLFLERKMQKPFARVWFGPSVFILVQKQRSGSILKPLQ